MEKAADVKDSADDLGKGVRDDIEDLWGDAVRLMRKSPGTALAVSLAVSLAAGVAAGAFLTRMLSPRPSQTERKLCDWVGQAQSGWGQFRDGLDQGVSILKSAVHHLS